MHLQGAAMEESVPDKSDADVAPAKKRLRKDEEGNSAGTMTVPDSEKTRSEVRCCAALHVSCTPGQHSLKKKGPKVGSKRRHEQLEEQLSKKGNRRDKNDKRDDNGGGGDMMDVE